jgi:hypothetical protein
LAFALWAQQIFLALLAGWLVMGELTRGRPRPPSAPLPEMSFETPTRDASQVDPGPEPGPEAESETRVEPDQ